VSWLLQELCVPVSKTAGSCVTGLLYDNSTNVLLLRSHASQFLSMLSVYCCNSDPRPLSMLGRAGALYLLGLEAEVVGSKCHMFRS
jgi:hypothetical protein